ncbi:amidase [Subsaximicrobium wynnwilliamsii]|uniref:Amidase n=1 Tax=Subsaximicrobium wynnwilliamsii TaxID=291179 RepID=A0A5C6ZJY9_9FLAO|nr:amidase family protein [Subsaximicrobium wynnwilliamsii]TXD84853.1 amidase [Subsaximicrobium wynnwilliamsii]TXD90524.1 amidase [Subsaximicrobium wynnwilliamsii]TXE04999.1 amidase [Subsaximicrobium wynnwilliamsii]
MRSLFLLSLFLIFLGCKSSEEEKNQNSESKKDANLSAISNKPFREFKVLDSKYLQSSEIWAAFDEDFRDFTEDTYNALKPLILEQDIPTIQQHIATKKLSYELLTKFYLYRIKTFDRENDLSLNAVIAINPDVINEARQRDKELMGTAERHPIFGMPILLKDNINTRNLPTTAGSVALQENNTETDAFITQRLIENGALILGKTNLSEWAYYFCGNCPSGFSAIGGQTLNPYGRKTLDTGGSSSGSGVAVAANFCVAAVGTETAGSILSPASQNSVVGLKPSIGLLSRSGIVPISSTLDTPGPISKNVIDNAILLDAMSGYDAADFKAYSSNAESRSYFQNLSDASVKSKRFGAFKNLMEDSLYVNAIAVLKSQGAEIIEISEVPVEFPAFLRLLNLDMKKDLPTYFSEYGNQQLNFKTVEDLMAFNEIDSLNTMPYGQNLFKAVAADSASKEEHEAIKQTLKTNGRRFFDIPMQEQNLDAVLSMNNYHAAEAAVAEYPALTVPMGYALDAAPEGLTFISKPKSEKKLLGWGYVYEQASKMRKAPKAYN